MLLQNSDNILERERESRKKGNPSMTISVAAAASNGIG
jgi:hypothetical protein